MKTHRVILALLATGLGCSDKKATPAATGTNDEFCKLLDKQFESLAHLDLSDLAKRGAYFSEQRALNGQLVKVAPAALANDVRFQTTQANAMLDAQIANDVVGIKTAAKLLASSSYLAATKRITDYCAKTIVGETTGNVPTVAANALFQEMAAPGEYLPDLGGKYDNGVVISGKVSKVDTELGMTSVALAAGPAQHVALTFTDNGIAVRRRAIKPDDSMTALCKLGGMSGKSEAILGECTLQ